RVLTHHGIAAYQGGRALTCVTYGITSVSIESAATLKEKAAIPVLREAQMKFDGVALSIHPLTLGKAALNIAVGGQDRLIGAGSFRVLINSLGNSHRFLVDLELCFAQASALLGKAGWLLLGCQVIGCT